VIELASWRDLEAAVSEGFGIGSGTRTDPSLSQISRPEELESEIAGSRTDIEERLGVPCTYLSWSHGTLEDCLLEVDGVVAGAGYSGMFRTIRGSIQPGTPADPYPIPRDHFEEQRSISHVRGFLAGHREHSRGE